MKTIAGDLDRDERAALEGLEPELAALQARHAGDPPVDMLRAAREGVLPDEWQAQVSTHLAESEWSRVLADDLDALTPGPSSDDVDRMLARVRAGARRERPQPAGVVLAWRPLVAFTGLAAAIVIFAVMPDWRPAAPVQSARAIDPPPPSAPAVPAPPEPAPTPAPAPVIALALVKPDLRVSLASLQWRGSAAGNPLLADLKPGFGAFEQGDFGEAARRLEPLAPRYPRSVEVFFYLGVSRLFLNDDRGAREALAAAERVADEAFKPDVAWYLAIADERLGDRAAARSRLDALCRAGTARASSACEAAAKLK